MCARYVLRISSDAGTLKILPMPPGAECCAQEGVAGRGPMAVREPGYRLSASRSGEGCTQHDTMHAGGRLPLEVLTVEVLAA
jgi:hypothetical protein